MISPQLDDRMRRVRILIRTRDDYLPQPHVTDLGDVPGPAPSRRVPCEACDRTGRYGKGHGRDGKRSCPACDGTGWRLRQSHEPEWCELTETTVAEAKQPVGAAGYTSLNQDIQRLTASIDRIQMVLDAKNGRYDRERFPWERARTMYHRQGSYAQLDIGLRRLNFSSPHIHAAVLTGRPLKLEQVGVAYLARSIPGQIRVPSFLTFEASVKQAPTVESLSSEGMTPGQIARRLRIPKRKVKTILARLTSLNGRVDFSEAGAHR